MEACSGWLTVKAPSLLRTKTFPNVWCALFKGKGEVSPRIDFYKKQSDSVAQKTIYLEDTKWREVDSLEPAFSIEQKNKQYIFFPGSEKERDSWISHLCCVSSDLMASKHLVAPVEKEQEVDNILYASSQSVQTFEVVAKQEDDNLKFGIKGVCRLTIGNGTILMQHPDSKKNIDWDLRQVKNFCHTESSFSVVAGSRSATGGGKFTFLTTESLLILKTAQDEICRLSREQPKPDPPEKPPRKDNAVSDNVMCNYANLDDKKDTIPNPSNTPGLPPRTPPGSRHGDEAVALGSNGSNFGSMNSRKLDPHVLESLDSKLPVQLPENDLHPPLGKTVSGASSNTTVSKKDAKELRKLNKKKEEEERKEKKRREEREKKEKKRKEEEEKKRIKKEKKKGESRVKTAVSTEPHYVDPDENNPIHGDPYQDIEEPYAETREFKPINPPSPPAAEQIYNEPWKSVPMAMAPTKTAETAVYSQPYKTSFKKAIQGREVIHTENYEPSTNVEAPPIIPPQWLPSEEESNNSTYELLNNEKTKVINSENVYGMGSASEPFNRAQEVNQNDYEDTGGAYETVGNSRG